MEPWLSWRLISGPRITPTCFINAAPRPLPRICQQAWRWGYRNIDWLLRWEYIAGYLPLIWKSGLFPTFNAANIVLIPYLDNMFGLQSHTKSLESNRTLFTLMGSHIHNSEYSLIMSFNDIKIICKTFWMFKTLYLMVPWSFATLEPEKIDQILIFQFVQWLCLCDVKYLPLKVFSQRGCLIFWNNNFLQSSSREGHLNFIIH